MLYNELFANEFDTQIIRKKLAKEIGLNEAIVLNQLHYWIEKNKRAGNNYYDGRYWVYNTYEKWQKEDFEYWSIDTVKRTFGKLEKSGLVISGNYNKMQIDRTKWYTIDYEMLEKMAENIEKSTIRTNCPNAKGQSDLSNNHRIPKNNDFINRSKTVATDFDDEILEKAKEYTDNETILDGINYFLKTFKQRMNKPHPNITYRSLDNVIGNIEELLINVDDIEDFENSNGFRLMVDNYFDTEYTEDVDYKIQHFASGKVLEYQARNVGLITGWRE